MPEKKEQLKNARPFTCSKEEGESRVLELEDLVLLQYTSVENVSVYSDQKFKIPKVIVLPVKTILSLGEKDEAA